MVSQVERTRAVGTTPVARVVGIVGIVGVVLLMVSVSVGSPGEPPLDASTTEAADYIRGLDATWLRVLEAVGDVAMMIVLAFMVGLSLLLRRFEQELPWRSTMAIVCGALAAAYVVLDPSEEAAVHRASQLDDRQLAYAYDLGTIGFTDMWLPLGAFALAIGWLVVSTGALPRWLGGWGLVAGVGLALAQLLWTVDSVWVIPYAPVWLWFLATGVVLVRRADALSPRASLDLD